MGKSQGVKQEERGKMWGDMPRPNKRIDNPVISYRAFPITVTKYAARILAVTGAYTHSRGRSIP